MTDTPPDAEAMERQLRLGLELLLHERKRSLASLGTSRRQVVGRFIRGETSTTVRVMAQTLEAIGADVEDLLDAARRYAPRGGLSG